MSKTLLDDVILDTLHSPHNSIKASDIRNEYRARCEKAGVERMCNKEYGKMLKKHFTFKKTNKSNIWIKKEIFNGALELYKDQDNWDNKKVWDKTGDNILCIIGLFCSLYEQHRKIPYMWSAQTTSIQTSTEYRFAKELLNNFNTGKDCQEYIKTQFNKKGKHIFSIKYLSYAKTINNYKCAKKQEKKLYTRNEPIPAILKEWCSVNIPAIFKQVAMDTINDLYAVVGVVNGGYGTAEQVELIRQAQALGIV